MPHALSDRRTGSFSSPGNSAYSAGRPHRSDGRWSGRHTPDQQVGAIVLVVDLHPLGAALLQFGSAAERIAAAHRRVEPAAAAEPEVLRHAQHQFRIVQVLIVACRGDRIFRFGLVIGISRIDDPRTAPLVALDVEFVIGIDAALLLREFQEATVLFVQFLIGLRIKFQLLNIVVFQQVAPTRRRPKAADRPRGPQR